MLYVEVTDKLSDIRKFVDIVKKNGGNIGCILVFQGVVRGESKGRKVEKLYYEAQEKIAEDKLREISEDIRERYGVLDVAIEHKIGEAGVGEEVLNIVISSQHRVEGLYALEELIDRLKVEVPIWKKEITDKGEHWITESKPKKVMLVIDGKKVPINPFVSEILSKVILAMISTLKGVDILGDERIVVKVYRNTETHNSCDR